MSSLRSPWRSGAFWLAVQAVAVFACHVASPAFAPIVRVDSRLYVHLAREATLPEILASIRTAGYPLFLRAVGSLCPEYGCLPAIQLGLFLLAVAGLYAALKRFGFPDPPALAAASGALYSPLVREMAPSMMTDLPAASLGLGCLALLLLLVREPARRWPWALLGVCLVLAYQVRPAYLFLLGLVPALALGLRRMRSGQPLLSRASLRLAAGLAALGIGPLLVFCALRWAVVGHFGLVGFTGHCLIGITASMLDEEVVAGLPAGERGLAREILDARNLRGLAPLDAGSGYSEWHRAFIKNNWRIGIPAAKRAWREEYGERARAGGPIPPRDLDVHARLQRLSVAILRARPGLYLIWLGRAWGAALAATLAKPWIWIPLALAGASLSAAAWRRRREVQAGRSVSPNAAAIPALGLLATAVAFYGASLALVLLVEPPQWRYLTSAELLLPGALAAVAAASLPTGRRPPPRLSVAVDAFLRP